MIRMLNACTWEIDDVDAAVSELLEQLDLKNRVLKNSVGIISCYTEFIETGVVKAVCGALPFDTVGCTTLGNSTRGECGLELLSLTVLTSDDVSFSVQSTAVKKDTMSADMKAAYDKARGDRGDPALVLTIAPLITDLSGSDIFNILNAAAGSIPVFGTFSCDHTPDLKSSATIRNGEAYPNLLSVILLYGEVRPRFYVTSIRDSSIQKQYARITASEGCLLKEVEGISPRKYFESLGLGGIDILPTITVVVNYHDGTKPAARGILSITPEGYILCAGEIPVNGSLSVATLDIGGILETAESTMVKVLSPDGEGGDVNGLLIVPCLTRSIMLGINGDEEMKKVVSLINGKYPYHIIYAGGEICPMEADDRYRNRYHNCTFTVCVL
jgi:hypothetical protein